MRPLRTAFLALALVSVAFAGCFDKEEVPAARSVSASGGKVSPGWAYDGQGVTPASASLSGTVNDPDNAGSLTSTFEYAGSTWTVTFDQFSGAQDFMDGGVEFELVEHGDSGVADASIPKILAKVAAWGTASVTRDGRPVAGAAGDRWSAHLMVSGDTVRQADGRILNAAGTAPYDPGSPGDATVTGGDAQAFLRLVHPDGETAVRQPVTGSQDLAFTGPEATQSAEIPSEAGASGLTVNVTLSGGANPAGVGQATVRLLDANGNETKTAQLTVTPQGPATTSWTLGADEVTGPFTVEVAGTGAFTATVEHVVTYDDHPFLVLTWDEPTFEAA